MYCGKCGKQSKSENAFCTGCGGVMKPDPVPEKKNDDKPVTPSSRKTQNKPDFKYEIIKHIGVLSEGSNGWRKELNVVSWNERDGKFDIRDWSPNNEKMGKGVALSKGEVAALSELLGNLFEDSDKT